MTVPVRLCDLQLAARLSEWMQSSWMRCFFRPGAALTLPPALVTPRFRCRQGTQERAIPSVSPSLDGHGQSLC